MTLCYRLRLLLASVLCALSLYGCIPGVFGEWLVKTDPGDSQGQRAVAVLKAQGFSEWKEATNSSVPESRFFAHREYPVGVDLKVSDDGVRVSFEEHLDRISTGGARIFLALGEALRSEFGPAQVIQTRSPRGLDGTP